ncbi:cis-prenyltransferase [Mortierella alpina]|nr:cis-prenyltransferase [Mortierella alpina]
MRSFKSVLRSTAVKALQCGPIPKHVGFIMDGNRRYGRKVQVGSGKGYYLGYDTLQEMLAVCMELGVKVVTVYAFSIENFKRPPDQVETLMELAKTRLVEMCEHSGIIKLAGVSIRVLGDDSLLPEDVREVVRRAVDSTKMNNRAILNICFPYTSRQELAAVTRSLVSGVEAHDLDPSDITTNTLENSLYTRSCPPLDILIRTSGEIRLSDFMLWQSSRSCHIEFVDCYWPEFTFWKLLPILLRYQLRATSIRRSRQEHEQQDESVTCSSTAAETNGRATAVQDHVAYDKQDPEKPGSSITPSTSASESAFSIAMCDEPNYSNSKDKRQRVADFLAQRGHLPNCPLITLQ